MYAGVNVATGVREGVIGVMAETFGRWLRARILARYKTLRAFAKAIDKEATYISRWVNDHEKPSYESARQIADLLDIPLTEVLARAGMPVCTADPGEQAEATPVDDLLSEFERQLSEIPGVAAQLRAKKETDPEDYPAFVRATAKHLGVLARSLLDGPG